MYPPYREYDPRTVHYSILDAVTSLWGDARTSEIKMSVVMCEWGYVVIRCVRGTERYLETAVSTVALINGLRVVLRSVATSGTLRSLKIRMKEESMNYEVNEYMLSARPYEGKLLAGQKVDLVEKGIKNQKRLYFTKQELEES